MKNFNNFFDKKRVLVTGNTGFKGSWLTMWLLKLGSNVVGFSKDIPTKRSLYSDAIIEKEIQQIWGDILNEDLLTKTIKKYRPEIIFHLAAQAIVSDSYISPLETFKTNALGTASMLEATKKADLDCIFISITSDKSYDNQEWDRGYIETDRLGGKDPYSASKGAAELILKSYFFSFLKNSQIKLGIGRAGNVLGGGDWATSRIIPDAFRSWKVAKPLEIRAPNSTRPWQLVLEPLSGYLHLAEKLSTNAELSGEAFNFGPNYEDINTVQELITKIYSCTKKYNFGESFFKITQDSQFQESKLLRLNCEKALSYLDWKPNLNFDEVCMFISDWYETCIDQSDLTNSFSLKQIDKFESIAKKRKMSWTT